MFKYMIGFFFIFCVLCMGQSTLWYVGSTDRGDDFDTIQEGVDDVNVLSGDTLRCRNKTYGPVEIVGKNLRIVSDRNDPENCIVDANDTGSCFYIENANVFIKGFTIEDGSGSVISSDPYIERCGGGICARPADWIEIENCIIKNNAIVSTGSFGIAEGGGVYIKPYYFSSTPSDRVVVTIEECEFENNTCNPALGSDDGENCWGGGLFCLGLEDGSIIQQNIFTGNIADDYGGSIHLGHSKSVKLDSNQLYNNGASGFRVVKTTS